jgi:hypothetical protein
MNALLERVGTWGEQEIDGRQAIRALKRAWEVGEQEGYWSGKGRLADDAVLVAAAHQE